jgi:hypothetical protein
VLLARTIATVVSNDVINAVRERYTRSRDAGAGAVARQRTY